MPLRIPKIKLHRQSPPIPNRRANRNYVQMYTHSMRPVKRLPKHLLRLPDIMPLIRLPSSYTHVSNSNNYFSLSFFPRPIKNIPI
jgi:hypothetical protein